MKKILALTLVCVFVILSVCVQAAEVNVTARKAAVMDGSTGEILYEKNGDLLCVPASMTKVMSVYVVLSAVKNGEITLQDEISVTDSAYAAAKRWPEVTAVPMKLGESYTVDELIRLTLVLSACDAAVLLADAVCGNESAFVARMNEFAEQMELDATFADATGLENSYITPVSMAKLAQKLITDFPEVLEITKQLSVVINGKKYNSTNKLLGSYYYNGADGLKTGTTEAAGYCFCATAVRNGERVIAAVFDAGSFDGRFPDAQKLLDFGFSEIKKRNWIYTTDISVKANGAEIPAFYAHAHGGAVIFAEDLKDYGFDVAYVHDTRTVYLTYNPDKIFSPIPMDYYDSLVPGNCFMRVELPKTIRVVLNVGDKTTELHSALQLDGYTAISVDELAPFLDAFSYDAAIKTVEMVY